MSTVIGAPAAYGRHSARIRLALYVGVNALFWAAYVRLGFPRPSFDDSVIIGPSLGLLDYGRLTNIYLSREFYPDDIYLFYPASFSWVLAGWIAVFGKSMLALRSFYGCCGFLTSVPLGLMLGRYLRTPIALPLAPAFVFGCVAYTGFRYEPLGFATIASGVALLINGNRLVGYFLILATPTIAPTFLGVGAVAVAALFVRRPEGIGAVREAATVCAALIGAMIVLAAGVSGNVDGLISTMHAYSAIRQGVGGRGIGLGTPLFVLSAALIDVVIGRVLLKRNLGDLALQMPLLVTAAVPLSAATHLKPAVATAFDIAACLLLAITCAEAVAVRAIRPKGHSLLLTKAQPLAAVAVAAGLAVLNYGYASTQNIADLTPDLAAHARRAAMRVRQGQTLIVDIRVMEALGFPTHGHIEDSMNRHAWPIVRQDQRRIPADQYWVITRPALIAYLLLSEISPFRSRLDKLFIAGGLPRLPRDGICVIDAAASRRARALDPEAFANAVCDQTN